jgi:hypothetical protein
LDLAGNPTSAPRPPIAAVFNGIGVAGVIIFGTGFVSWGSIALTTLLVGRYGSASWDRQLSALRKQA